MGIQIGSARAGNRRRVYDFGYFASDIDAVLSYRRVASEKHPLDNWHRQQRLIDIPDTVKQQLNRWLIERKADQVRSTKRKKKKGR